MRAAIICVIALVIAGIVWVAWNAGHDSLDKTLGEYIFEVLGDPTPLPEATVRALQDPTGEELDLECPPSFIEAVEPTRLAEEMKKIDVGTYVPGPEELGLTPDTYTGTGTLCSVLPPDPFTGKEFEYCSLESNEELGVEFGGAFALEPQLNEMGRLCGATVHDYAADGIYVRLDKYKAVAGAQEAFRGESAAITYDDTPPPWHVDEEQRAAGEAMDKCAREAQDRLESNLDRSLLETIGEDRELQVSPSTMNNVCWTEHYRLLIRRGNIVARIDLGMDFGSPDNAVRLQSILEYAAELDRNIQAAAEQQSP